ncbi:MAG: hypoxanthine phosphoribosyltransferase [Flavobacteriaceae bacterium]|jgi:hypoxanthine phosphoribosyltransferase|nr:hypoxanthine phosphoribosyltransferase [Flavobacteriaceae bacterium]
MEIQVLDKKFVPFISEEKIQNRLAELAKQIETDMNGEVPVFIGVLNGSFMVVSDLVKKYKGACEMSFVKMASYIGTQSTNKVNQLMGLDIDVTDRQVIIVEDIVDTGNTVVALKQLFDQQRPKGVRIFTLCLKPEAYKKDIPLDYIAFEIENKFIVGYGMDYDKHGRNIPEIYQIKE